MKIVICDDQAVFLEKLKSIILDEISEITPPILLFDFSNPIDLLHYYQENKDIDLVFLDILMEPMNGYQTASILKKSDPKIKIVFLTSIIDYAIKGYEIGIEKYIMKPFNVLKFKKILTELIQEIQHEKEQCITVKNDEGFFRIFIQDIKYIETYGRNTMIHTCENDVISYKTLKDHSSYLGDNFYRCHSSYIINFQYVKSIINSDIELITGERIPVSRNKKTELMKLLTIFYSNKIS